MTRSPGGDGDTGEGGGNVRSRLGGLGRLQWVLAAVAAFGLLVASAGVVAAVWPDGGDGSDGKGGSASGRPGGDPKPAQEKVWTPPPRTELPDAEPGLPKPDEFAVEPRRHESDSGARLVDVATDRRKGAETVGFTFEPADAGADGEAKVSIPPYHMEYADAVRLYPDDEPIPVAGETYLIVGFELTDPNEALELAFPPRIEAGQPQVAEVLMYDNLGGSLRFAVGLSDQVPYRVVEEDAADGARRLVIEFKKP